MTATIRRPALRCAIYTRKSSEEGLEQSFNSLHAQREACEAYIKSQAPEGWRLVREAFDDGGYSGGTLERPALRRLLDNVRARSSVSPYLPRRPRSNHEALRDRLRRQGPRGSDEVEPGESAEDGKTDDVRAAKERKR